MLGILLLHFTLFEMVVLAKQWLFVSLHTKVTSLQFDSNHRTSWALSTTITPTNSSGGSSNNNRDRRSRSGAKIVGHVRGLAAAAWAMAVCFWCNRGDIIYRRNTLKLEKKNFIFYFCYFFLKKWYKYYSLFKNMYIFKYHLVISTKIVINNNIK